MAKIIQRNTGILQLKIRFDQRTYGVLSIGERVIVHSIEIAADHLVGRIRAA